MKTFLLLVFLIVSAILFGFKKKLAVAEPINGAWQQTSNGNDRILLFEDGYFTHTTYSMAAKRFVETHGGTFNLQNNTLQRVWEFDTQNSSEVGTTKTHTISLTNNQLTISDGAGKSVWTRVDNGTENLAGTWKITARKQDGTISPIHQSGPRKTLKILTSSRFQWAAINPATKEFFGTGGGTYTFTNGKYTEHIEFFSRDSSRVGAALSFDGKLEKGGWHHSGKSSRGDDIYEVWSRNR